ncbi:MAG TPA: NUDIX hydrolase [Tianweitania sediminis]|jgi:8-oxo-dGTP pyrophosphatase MutT (NUDIX family)|nr:NUDIX hydrolase [Tianweitania sediminis]
MTTLEGMSRAELDKKEAGGFALGKGPLRPRDAATLILLDRSGKEPRVLMGKRASRHAFMPGKFVFPGGRTDPTDSRVPVAASLHPDVERRLMGLGRKATPARARAIALSAIRETYEEAGLLIGDKTEFATTKDGWQAFSEHSVAPNLSKLRFVARAITPPGRVRRFDTRFLTAWRDDVAVALPEGPTLELEELSWLTFAEARKADLPSITLTILADLETRLQDDPELSPEQPTPFYRMLHNRFQRQLI